jgi:hypothetical protein
MTRLGNMKRRMCLVAIPHICRAEQVSVLTIYTPSHDLSVQVPVLTFDTSRRLVAAV